MSQAIHPRRFYIGTTAERGATILPSDANGASWWDTDKELMYVWTGTAWIGVHTLTSPDGLTDVVITDNSGNLTIPADIVHAGDPDTTFGFTDDDAEIQVGGLSMLKLTESTQDLITFGPGSGNVDIDFNGDMFLQGSDGKFGIGTTTIPHASIGLAKLAIEGPDASDDGPHIQITTDADNHPLLQIRAQSHDSIILSFDAYHNGTNWISSDVGSNYQINKGVDVLQFRYASGVSQGGTISWNNGFSLNTSGQVGMGTAATQGQIHAYNVISGFLLWEYDGLDATVRTIILNGSEDVLYRLHASYALRDSAGAVASGTTDISNAASASLTVGGNTVRLRVNADGSVDTNRTAGTDTIKVAYTLRWL